MLDPSTVALDEWHGLCVAHGYDVANARMRKRGGNAWSVGDLKAVQKATNEMLAMHPKWKPVIMEQKKGE